MQFNIGIEGERLRYGIAFSLEPSRTIPDVSILYPKVFKLNCIIRERPGFFSNYSMRWHDRQKNWSPTFHVREIPHELMARGNFIFIGKRQDLNNLDYDEILSTFDELLEIYIEVESGDNDTVIEELKSDVVFQFDSKTKTLTSHKQVSQVQKEISIDVRHSRLQEKLAEELKDEFGDRNVGMEQSFSGSGNKVDIAVKHNDKVTFYEVKVANSATACIRQAMGQLLEYAFWPGKRHANTIVIAGEPVLDKDAEKYISFLRDEFTLPVQYQQIEL